MPAGLITAIHYAGTPNTLASMYRAMTPMRAAATTHALELRDDGAARRDRRIHDLPRPADRARAQLLAADDRAAQRARDRHPSVSRRRDRAERDPPDLASARSLARRRWRIPRRADRGVRRRLDDRAGRARQRRHALHAQAAQHAENPLVLAAIIAIGIGAHNFGEGLAIGASAASGATAIALALIVGFALHNATEGFGVAAPLVGRVRPVLGADRPGRTDRRRTDVPRHDRRLQFLLADALGASSSRSPSARWSSSSASCGTCSGAPA